MKTVEELINLIVYRLRHNSCAFKKLTGYYCPGCGGSRSLRFLLKGDLVNSFVYHPAVPFIVLLLLLLIIQLCANIGKRQKPQLRLLRPVHGYILIGIIILQWLIKNLLLYCGIDLLSLHVWQI